MKDGTCSYHHLDYSHTINSLFQFVYHEQSSVVDRLKTVNLPLTLEPLDQVKEKEQKIYISVFYIIVTGILGFNMDLGIGN